MPRNDIESKLRARIDQFVTEISDLVREQALRSLQEAIARNGTAAARPRRTKAARAAAPVRRKAARTSGKRVRRSSEELEKLKGAILAHVKANPGQRLEEIGPALGIATKALKRPIQLLTADGALRTEGQRRGTKYFAGGGRAKAPAKPRKKAAKKKAGRKKAGRKKAT